MFEYQIVKFALRIDFKCECLPNSTGSRPFVREAHQLIIGSSEGGSGEEWTELPPMTTARAGHTCSTVTRSSAGGEREAVVVGGWNADQGDLDSVEVYNMQRKTWRIGDFKISNLTECYE